MKKFLLPAAALAILALSACTASVTPPTDGDADDMATSSAPVMMDASSSSMMSADSSATMVSSSSAMMQGSSSSMSAAAMPQ